MSPLSPQPLSPLDGRYHGAVSDLGQHLSEAGLNRARVRVEVEWLIFLVGQRVLETGAELDLTGQKMLRDLYEQFSDETVEALAKIEAKTRHDVKAVEILIRDTLEADGRHDLVELVHFACTSEDINNLSYALTIRAAVTEIWLPKAKALVSALASLAEHHAEDAMLSRTHGQAATPTTMGKEIAVFVHRLQRQLDRIEAQPYLGKFSGATGTYSAHVAAAPLLDWVDISKRFVESLGLSYNPLTTQIESHDWQAELFGAISHFNRVLHNLCTDFWTYISLGYFRQIPQPGATGSSTMPHKVNPIRFENAEANLELSSAILDSLASTLVTSRLQRDLTDSSAQRNIGVGFGHSLLALSNVLAGLSELELNRVVLDADLAENWEVLAEAIQTVIRLEIAAGRSKLENPYELLKELTRGKRISQEDFSIFINQLDISQEAKDRLLVLKPENYIGVAPQQAKGLNYFKRG